MRIFTLPNRSNMQKLFLLDAYALIYRAYYALIRSPRLNSRGENTSAVFGFDNTLDEVLRKERPDCIAVAFDPSGPTFRHEAYPAYKAQREATPEDIRRSVPVIKDIVRAYRIPLAEVAGFEADDVIGTLARRGAEAGMEVHMVTPDKDYAQLVAPGIFMHRPGHGGTSETLGPAEVCAKYGIERTDQVRDLLALMGDAADNIPGCPGVGEKTAVKLIREFDSVENLLLHTDGLRGALKKKVEEEDWTYIKSPAGIFTEATLPYDEIYEQLTNDTLNAVKLTFTNYKQTSSYEFSMSAPEEVLLIRKKDLKEFFEENKLPDNVTSFTVTHNNVSTNQYTFQNIARLVTTCINEKQAAKEAAGTTWNEEQWLKDNKDNTLRNFEIVERLKGIREELVSMRNALDAFTYEEIDALKENIESLKEAAAEEEER